MAPPARQALAFHVRRTATTGRGFMRRGYQVEFNMVPVCRRLAIVSWVVALCATARCGTAADAGAKSDDVFGLTRLHQVHVTIAPEDYARMDPPLPTQPSGFGPRPGVAGRDVGAGNFGFEFEYVPAEVRVGDETFADVGLRYKGSGTYLVSQFRAKRSLKIDFDRNDELQTFHGIAKLNLNSGVMDASKAREALAYAVFRAAGVPASRTAFAELTLTVPGKFDSEYLGLYTAVEQVDKRFLRKHFGDGDGLLLKPEGIRGLPHFGDKLETYVANYLPKDAPAEGELERLVELTRLINKADEAEFREKIGQYLDVESFARFLAANVMLASLDGFVGLGHNFYLYLSPKTGRFTFIPWDLDLAFGGFAFYGSPEQLTDLSLDHPHVGENKLIERLMAMPEFKANYREHVRRLAAETFADDKLGADVAAAAALAKEPIARELAALRARSEGENVGFGPTLIGTMPLEEFIAKRLKSVEAQLDGSHSGFVPQESRFGPPGGPGGGGPARRGAAPPN
jgi:spore coat protein H